MKVVCIKSGPWVATKKNAITDTRHPLMGEIYHVENMTCQDGKHYYFLQGFESLYSSKAFREVDNTFGHVVCHTIQQQIQLEQTIVL